MRVVHCMSGLAFAAQAAGKYVYIGRGGTGGLGNPFRIGAMTREQAIRAFESHARGDPNLMAKIKRLGGDSVLGCFCKARVPGERDYACHGDVVVKLWREMHGQVSDKAE